MNLPELLVLMKAYSELSWSIREQLETIADDPTTMGEQNENALAAIRDFLDDEVTCLQDECLDDVATDAMDLKVAIDAFLSAKEE